MKHTFIILLLGALTFAGGRATAQLGEESRIKVIQTHEPGIVKVIYGFNPEGPLNVYFNSPTGRVGADKIEGNYPAGISKKYDVRKLSNNDVWVEITSPFVSVTYRLVPSKDRQTFVPYLEKTTYNHRLMVANKR